MVSAGLLAALSARLLLAETLTQDAAAFQRMPPDSGDGGLTFAGERKPLRSGQLRTGAAFDQQRNETANGAALESDECRVDGGRSVAGREVRVP
jgi:hypothetical protein